ncbi:hypothetical protein K2F54_12540 [Cryobacterium sp. 1639]|uniref:hypothetical protein n=1 Tax=Cryobacterium inferilacus TaxID=2866629 RepID=UPI001C73B815|nr:hypothetical protein [Cryobacterium sp. 1639]MBX0300802.1 hypothetical protein [Cryobacterium sp. 1639]
MNSYISTPGTTRDRSAEPAGYVSTGQPAASPAGYISPASHRGAGSYVATEWVTAA